MAEGNELSSGRRPKLAGCEQVRGAGGKSLLRLVARGQSSDTNEAFVFLCAWPVAAVTGDLISDFAVLVGPTVARR